MGDDFAIGRGNPENRDQEKSRSPPLLNSVSPGLTCENFSLGSKFANMFNV